MIKFFNIHQRERESGFEVEWTEKKEVAEKRKEVDQSDEFILD